MSHFESEVLSAIATEQRLLVVQDQDVGYYKKLLNKHSQTETPRALLIWDDNGLDSQTYNDPLPTDADLPAALDFVIAFKGRGVFLFDCTTVDVTQTEGFARRFRKLSDKLALDDNILLLVLTAAPWPASLGKYVTLIGASEEAAPTASAPRRPAVTTNAYRAIQNRDEFDTPEWHARIQNLTMEELQEIVNAGAYKDAYDRVVELRELLKKRFARKTETFNALFAAAVAQVPCVLMGPPGTAKGHMIRSMCEGLGLAAQPGASEQASRRYFEYQLTRFTTPEEIFGPIHVQELIDHHKYRRVTEGYLPTAHVAFLDEIFKASSAILNTLLSLLNERVFYNEGRSERVPLTQVFAASNEPPQDESLNALYDRFPLRLNCPPVDDDHLHELMDRAWEDGFDRTFGGAVSAVPVMACANDLRLLHRVSKFQFGGRATEGSTSPGGRGFKVEFLRCFRALRHEAAISDRSLSALYSFARASALLAGRQSMNADELDVFRLVRWDPSGELDRFVANLKRGYGA